MPVILPKLLFIFLHAAAKFCSFFLVGIIIIIIKKTHVCEMEAQSEHVHIAHAFFASLGSGSHAQSALSNKNFLRRSSGGSLLRVRRWLGTVCTRHRLSKTFFF